MRSLARLHHVTSRVERRLGRRDRGVSTIELISYTPLLMLVVFIAVQFSLYYLGSQVASSTAREAARIVRTGGTPAQAQARAQAYARQLGNGLISQVAVRMETPTRADNVRVKVTAEPLSLVRLSQLTTVTAVSEGPIEIFRPDTGGGP